MMVPDSLISAMATVRESDLTGDMLARLGDPGDSESDPRCLLLGELDPLPDPEDRGESGLGESGLPDPLVRLLGAGLLCRSGEFLI